MEHSRAHMRDMCAMIVCHSGPCIVAFSFHRTPFLTPLTPSSLPIFLISPYTRFIP